MSVGLWLRDSRSGSLIYSLSTQALKSDTWPVQKEALPLNCYSHSQIFSPLSFDGVGRRQIARVKAWSVAIGPSGLYLPFRTTDGSQVYTAHTATAFIQHVDMRHWKFPLCRGHVGGGGVKKSSEGET